MSTSPILFRKTVTVDVISQDSQLLRGEKGLLGIEVRKDHFSICINGRSFIRGKVLNLTITNEGMGNAKRFMNELVKTVDSSLSGREEPRGSRRERETSKNWRR